MLRNVFTRWRRTAAMLVASTTMVVISLGVSPPAGAAVPTITPTLLGQVQAAEESVTFEVSRDDGAAVAVPGGNELWVFGDTGEYTKSGSNWNLTDFIEGSTAAEGAAKAGTAPTGLEEVMVGSKLKAGNQPSQFIPTPVDIYIPGEQDKLCTAGAAGPNGETVDYPARWTSGTTLMPNGKVLVTYGDVCVLHVTQPQPGTTAQLEGYGFLELNPATNKIVKGPDDVIPPQTNGAALPPDESFGSPVVENNTLYLFSSECYPGWEYGVCPSGYVWVTTLKATDAAMEKATHYSPVAVTPGDGTSWYPGGTTFNYYPGVGYVLVEETSIGGTFNLYTARAATGPWVEEATGTLPGCSSNSVGFCYAFTGHPELSDTSELELTYYYPGYGADPSAGKLVAATLPVTG